MEMVISLRFALSTAVIVGIAAALAVAPSARGAGNHHDHGPSAGVRSLDVCADGARIHRLTGESMGDNPAQLFHAFSEDGGATWSHPQRVGTGMPAPFGLRRGMDAQIAGTRGVLLAAWTTAGTDKWGSGPIATAVSADGGKTWAAGPNPADDGATTGHGFMDITADEQGTFHLTWLDSRDGNQGLRYARSEDRGKTWSKNQTLKAGTCECCSNAFAVGPDGKLAIIFRDKAPRDMAVVASADAGQTWAHPSHAGRFNWNFDGCPHVGGALAFGRGDSARLHAAVWTGVGERAGVYYTSSSDRAEWSEPRALGGSSATRPDLAAHPDGSLAIVWDEATDHGGQARASFSTDNGRTWSEPKTLSGTNSRATHPRLVATKNGFLVVWTEVTEHQGVKLGSAALTTTP